MKVFVSGFGTVGQGIVELITMKGELLDSLDKDGVKIVGIMDSKSYSIKEDGLCTLCTLGKKRSMGRCGDDDRKGMEGKDILDMVDYDVLIECTPTNIEHGGEGLHKD